MKANDIFFGSDGKLRSGFRFAVFSFGFIALAYFVFGFANAVLTHNLALSLPSATVFALNSFAGFLPALLLGWLCGKYLEGLPFRALGASPTTGWGKHFLIGSILGAASLLLAVSIAASFGDLHFAYSGAASADIGRSAFLSFLIFAAAAAFEEVLFRGYILQTFARSGLAWLAILLTSIFFGLVHLNNPNANIFGAANTALAGVWFGVAYLKTRDLWFVWGLHLFWNWMQGSIFGIEVSGLTEIVSSSLFKESDRGPDWLTGGNYGIEASIACTIVLIASTIAIYYLPFLKPSEEMMKLTSPAGDAEA